MYIRAHISNVVYSEWTPLFALKKKHTKYLYNNVKYFILFALLGGMCFFGSIFVRISAEEKVFRIGNDEA